MNRNRIVILAVVAVVAFGGAYLAFRGDDSSSEDAQAQAGGSTALCSASGGPDPSYEVKVEEQPKVEAQMVKFALTHNGKAVNDAKVCLDVNMSGMSHPPAGGEAKHMAGGRYEVEAKFPMRGPWAGSVTVAEQGKSPASIPVAFDVQ